MKKNLIYSFAISAMFSLIAVSCTKNEDPAKDQTPANGEGTVTISAVIESSTYTKTSLEEADEDGFRQVSWKSGDEISVLHSEGSTKAATTDEGTKADFNFDAPDGDVWLVYPSASGSALNEGTLELTVPAEQDGSFAKHGYLVAKSNTAAGNAMFFNACSMFKIYVSDATVRKAVITGNNGEKLAGTVKYTWANDNEAPAADVSAADATSLTVTFNGEGEYLVAALPGLELTGGVTIRFYRDNDEPAGGNRTESELTVNRAKIASFGDSDAICSRYVSTTGSADNDGRTPSNPWNIAQFKSFMEAGVVSGEKLAAMGGVTIHFAAGTYAPTKKIVPDMTIKVNLVGESSETTIFDGGGDKILFDIYKKSGETVTFKNFTFKNGYNSSTSAPEGGAFRIGNSDRIFNITFEDCVFENNVAPTSTGGVMNIISNSTVSFANCVFKGNKAEKSHSGVVSVSSYANASFTNCQFLENSASTGACIGVRGSGNVIKLDHCLFKDNTAATRGMIQVNDNALVYMNSVAFTGNKTTGSESPWGLLYHGGASFVCMNNVTAFGNKNENDVTSNSAAFNGDGGMLVTNSTLVDYGGQYIVRVNDVSSSGVGHLTLCNNIIVNRSSGKANSTHWVRNTISIQNCGHNLFGCSGLPSANVPASNPATDMFNCSHETLGGSWSEVWDAQNKYGVYSWPNSLTGFTPATSANVEAAIKACTVSMAGVENVGTDFYNWLVSIGGFDTDARGVSRGTGNWWPGSYQN